MSLEAGFTALYATPESTAQPAPDLELGSTQTHPGTPFTSYAITPQPI